MSTFRRIGPKLFLGGIVLGVFLIGWANRYSIAESRPQDLPAPAPSGGAKEALPSATPESIKPESAAASPGSAPAEALALPSVSKDALSPEPILNPITASPAPAPVVVGPDHSPIEAEDPEKVATEFLEQNQKLAEAQLKALKEEAQKLKARLTKVEAGIKRWDRLLVALNQSQGAAAVEGADPERPVFKSEAKVPAEAHDDAPPPTRAEPGSKRPNP
jgi:nucleotide-binding universal stress UspA family protein